MSGVLAIALAGLVSYGLRAGLVLIADRWKPSAVVTRATSLVAPAAFAALAATAVKSHLLANVASSIPLVVGLLLAAIGVRKTGSANTALVVGLPTVWLLSAVL